MTALAFTVFWILLAGIVLFALCTYDSVTLAGRLFWANFYFEAKDRHQSKG